MAYTETKEQLLARAENLQVPENQVVIDSIMHEWPR